MAPNLQLSIGQYSDKGRKDTNQDFHGVMTPQEPLLTLKGISIALADGISSSPVSRVAAESTIKSFLTDYYCTSESWSVKTSAYRVIAAINSWLHAQSRRGQNPYDKDKGYVCTLSVMVVKAATAHLFHIGDSRVYRLVGRSLEQLTQDHRLSVSSEQSYLARAMGMMNDIEIDYRAVPLAKGDIFLLATDGVYDHVGAKFIAATIKEHAGDLDAAARNIVAEAFAKGSADNLTVQIVRVDSLAPADAVSMMGQAAELPLPPMLQPRMVFDGYTIVRQIHANSRSHIFLAQDSETKAMVALKIPSVDLREDASYLKRFMMEEWVARRIDSAHVVKPCAPTRRRNFLYTVAEFVEGQTLAQWMIDNPNPDLHTVRDLIEQIARGVQAFHRREMLHQDLRPANIMIDRQGTVKILDFGSTRVSGVLEASPHLDGTEVLGTAQYTAPEYYLGEGGTRRSDLYALAAIAYHMLSGRLPYGGRVSAARSRAQQRKLRYESAVDENSSVPAWVDVVFEKALAINPKDRFSEVTELVYALRNPAELLATRKPRSLLERNPLLFWRMTTFVFGLTTLVLGAARMIGR